MGVAVHGLLYSFVCPFDPESHRFLIVAVLLNTESIEKQHSQQAAVGVALSAMMQQEELQKLHMYQRLWVGGLCTRVHS